MQRVDGATVRGCPVPSCRIQGCSSSAFTMDVCSAFYVLGIRIVCDVQSFDAVYAIPSASALTLFFVESYWPLLSRTSLSSLA